MDEVPWRSELFTAAPEIEDGYLTVPTTPGWGTEPIEQALKAHPPRQTDGLLGLDKRAASGLEPGNP